MTKNFLLDDAMVRKKDIWKAMFACRGNLSSLASKSGAVYVPIAGICVDFRFIMELLGIR